MKIKVNIQGRDAAEVEQEAISTHWSPLAEVQKTRLRDITMNKPCSPKKYQTHCERGTHRIPKARKNCRVGRRKTERRKADPPLGKTAAKSYQEHSMSGTVQSTVHL